MVNANPNLDPWAVTKDPTQSTGNTARDARYALGALGHPSNTNTFSWADGVFPSSMNGSLISDYQVTALGSPTMAVLVNYGNAQIGRLNNGPYTGSSTGSQTITFAASNPSNPRIDYVVIHTADAGVETNPVQTWNVGVYTGTPGATPVEPVSQMTDNDLLLAAVTVRANTNQILTGDISDRRMYVTARGGITPKSASDARTGAYVGQYRDNPVTGALERWDGISAWIQVASASTWNSWTPQLKFGGVAPTSNRGTTMPTAGTSVAGMGTGAVMLASYNVVGKVINLSYSMTWGTPPYNSGTGVITTTLPPGWVHTTTGGPSIIPAWLQVADTASSSFGFFSGAAAIFPNSNIVFPMFRLSSPVQTIPQTGTSASIVLDQGLDYYKAADQQGTPGHSVPLIPTGFPQGGTLFIQGTLEIS